MGCEGWPSPAALEADAQAVETLHEHGGWFVAVRGLLDCRRTSWSSDDRRNDRCRRRRRLRLAFAAFALVLLCLLVPRRRETR